MENKITPIIIEKESVSDDYYLITDIYIENGQFIEEGEPILSIETSKSTIDIEATEMGYVFLNCEKSEKVKTGQVIAAISKDKNLETNWFDSKSGEKSDEITEIQHTDTRISKPAKKLIKEHDIDISVFKGKSFVGREDIEHYLNKQKTNSLPGKKFDASSIFVYGGGGHGKMCIEIIKQTNDFNLIGIIDANIPVNKEILDIPVIGNEAIFDELIEKNIINAVLGIGGGEYHLLRKEVYNQLKKKGFYLPNIIHPVASVEPSVKMGEGNHVLQGAIIGCATEIGNNCIINSGSIVSHDTKLGNNVHIAPGAIIAGKISIGDDTIIGMGVTLYVGIKIGKNVIIHNGVNVFQDVPDDTVVKYENR